MNIGSPRTARTAFTLIEMLVAMTVLTILVVGIVQMLNSASSAAANSKSHLESDDQARMVMDRISQDLNLMVKASSVDFHFPRANLADTNGTTSWTYGVNGGMFFYTELPGYTSTGATGLPSDVSLVGYRVDSNAASSTYHQLERYASLTQWDGANTGSMVYLTYSPSASSCAPLAATTIAAIQTLADSTNLVNPTCVDANFHVLGEDVFRLEFCYLLKDGSYSTYPVLYYPPSTWPFSWAAVGINPQPAYAPPTFYTEMTSPPSVSNGATTYAPGSRWYDTAAQRAYICVSAPTTSNSAVWRALGWQDVSAVVVTIATMDKASRKLLLSLGNDKLSSVASALLPTTAAELNMPTPRPTTPFPNPPLVPTLAAQKWLAKINGSLAADANIPQKSAASVHVYQRYHYIIVQ